MSNNKVNRLLIEKENVFNLILALGFEIKIFPSVVKEENPIPQSESGESPSEATTIQQDFLYFDETKGYNLLLKYVSWRAKSQ